ncbi:MAG: malic enzyme-like NAD(P)-binding protein [Nanoarchaeota archaeon]
MDENKVESMDYHSGKKYEKNPVMNKPGKTAVLVTKGCETQGELSLAYTPFVGKIVEDIHRNPEQLPKLTSYSNKGAVISDGTAILGFGDLGPKAATPVMEGKSVLFKVFGDVDMDSIVINEKDPKKIIEFVMKMEPNYAGINLEDISAPRCFEIEEELQKRYKGFIFHDDQHGTATITLGGLLNALELVNLKKEDAKVVICGAGAAAIASAKLYKKDGIKKIIMLDRNGAIFKGRNFPTNKYKEQFAIGLEEYGLNPDKDGKITLKEAIKEANVFLGLSAANLLTGEMVESMAKDPIIIAMANPVPEILPDAAYEHGAKIVATGRSDFPNQINNVLGFPGIFRGALDALISKTTDDIKLAAAYALKDLAHKPVPEEVKDKYPKDKANGVFEGEDPVKPEYIVPLALDPRVAVEVAAAVYKTAFEKGIATAKLPEGFNSAEEYIPAYKKEVMERIKVQDKLREAVRNSF